MALASIVPGGSGPTPEANAFSADKPGGALTTEEIGFVLPKSDNSTDIFCYYERTTLPSRWTRRAISRMVSGPAPVMVRINSQRSAVIRRKQKLWCCKTDARALLLTSEGFKRATIDVLIDRRARQQEIVTGLPDPRQIQLRLGDAADRGQQPSLPRPTIMDACKRSD